MNNCIFLGNLTRDPELIISPNGTPQCDLAIAVNHIYYTPDNMKHEKTSYPLVRFFGNRAEHAVKHFRLGSRISVECRFVTESWEDKATGEKRTRSRFDGINWHFCEAKPV